MSVCVKEKTKGAVVKYGDKEDGRTSIGQPNLLRGNVGLTNNFTL